MDSVGTKKHSKSQSTYVSNSEFPRYCACRLREAKT
ncbi:uncharacterized protein PRCAT00000442001 [Priceomyces carsonii]|nr:unnamed protein product [Priceomyces carsonii]